MKVNELMVGDWVLTLEPTHKKKVYAQIWAIKGQTSILVKKDNCTWFVDIEWIEPIPLTAEILGKKGFVGKEEGHYYSYHIRYGRLGNSIFDVHYQNHRIACSTPDNRDEFALFGMIVLRYFHELQHALRLCGIDKELVL